MDTQVVPTNSITKFSFYFVPVFTPNVGFVRFVIFEYRELQIVSGSILTKFLPELKCFARYSLANFLSSGENLIDRLADQNWYWPKFLCSKFSARSSITEVAVVLPPFSGPAATGAIPIIKYYVTWVRMNPRPKWQDWNQSLDPWICNYLELKHIWIFRHALNCNQKTILGIFYFCQSDMQVIRCNLFHAFSLPTCHPILLYNFEGTFRVFKNGVLHWHWGP